MFYQELIKLAAFKKKKNTMLAVLEHYLRLITPRNTEAIVGNSKGNLDWSPAGELDGHITYFDKKYLPKVIPAL